MITFLFGCHCQSEKHFRVPQWKFKSKRNFLLSFFCYRNNTILYLGCLFWKKYQGGVWCDGRICGIRWRRRLSLWKSRSMGRPTTGPTRFPLATAALEPWSGAVSRLRLSSSMVLYVTKTTFTLSSSCKMEQSSWSKNIYIYIYIRISLNRRFGS